MAIARKLSAKSLVLLVERHSTFGHETSSRNSEVIHAGLYYPGDSLKSRLCIQGKELLYSFCKQHSIPHAKIGKWVVANTEEECHALETLAQNCARLNVPVFFETKAHASHLEPFVKAQSILSSPSTGIIDSRAYLETLEAHALSNQAILMNKTTFEHAIRQDDGYHVQCMSRGKPLHIISQVLINAAGHGSQGVASTLLSPELMKSRQSTISKGRYYKLVASRIKVHRLIYPVPDPTLKSLGIHLTLDLNGGLRFGPDISPAASSSDYAINHSIESRDAFYESVVKYLPSLQRDQLVPDYCGIRPKLQGPNSFRDFLIEQPLPGFINLMGIESPGLTSSLAIAEYVQSII